MCGINGFIQFKKRYNKSRLYNIVHEMNESKDYPKNGSRKKETDSYDEIDKVVGAAC